jgi:hypothetical protein
MAKNIEEVVKEASKDVIFDFKQVGEKPEEFSEWLECGEKGIPFEFFDGEIITLPPFDKIRIWGRREKIGKKTFPILYTAIESDRQGAIEMPLSILRRMPALKDEISKLMEGNVLGAPLLSKMSDIKRLAKLSQLAGEGMIRVTDAPFHTNDFDQNGKVIRDSAEKPESERRPLMCHRFNLAS